MPDFINSTREPILPIKSPILSAILPKKATTALIPPAFVVTAIVSIRSNSVKNSFNLVIRGLSICPNVFATLLMALPNASNTSDTFSKPLPLTPLPKVSKNVCKPSEAPSVNPLKTSLIFSIALATILNAPVSQL